MKDPTSYILDSNALIGCENVPDAMIGSFDRPWIYIGDVQPGLNSIACICETCNQAKHAISISSTVKQEQVDTVRCDGFRFITDDKLLIIVYFGVCRRCKSVYWGKSGPPFQRARALVLT